ncbi:DUF4332 domain-containing protein [Legionella oakridgensis]|uniref:DUF4332 domain-containing protein n=2 Tax=Legionella oakridgensis TaxID=29423 RepID=W0BBE3_9GAMM|nr:DUF4332 domain-containing protein [Legionella oakridgensis]AHE66016.1 hypothetical protein Loa_00438 [Legionella oakridgensis ATCC 33761 = DSM 21215]ETO94248.1 hypothetical protein LOR_83c23930 [Legionella oakridgensis RV-2-2007]KTD43575.1 hypothetical protein Loak_0551 [Legionella oakridgensis]STY15942.1 putative RecB family nuclease, TM0106 family [Legionella longbeachae]
MYKLSQLESIGVKFRELLQKAGIEDQEQLLAACSQRSGRQALAKETGINPKLILKWTQQADLARINGIGEEYAELLEFSGVDSVQTLAQFTPEKLFQTMLQVNEQANLVRAMPSMTKIESWIEQAQTLPSMLE